LSNIPFIFWALEFQEKMLLRFTDLLCLHYGEYSRDCSLSSTNSLLLYACTQHVLMEHIIVPHTYLGLVEEKMVRSDKATLVFSTISEMYPWGNVWCNQSYEIKLPPRPILGFKILEINAQLSIVPEQKGLRR
jgi:hypothetical protein